MIKMEFGCRGQWFLVVSISDLSLAVFFLCVCIRWPHTMEIQKRELSCKYRY